MFTITLHNLVFHSFHGIHEEEKILGNTFIVDAEISFQEEDRVDSLEQTINYASVFEIIKRRMAVPTALLETIAQDLAGEIRLLDERISSIRISIQKKHPPIRSMEGSVGVTYRKDY